MKRFFNKNLILKIKTFSDVWERYYYCSFAVIVKEVYSNTWENANSDWLLGYLSS